MYITQTDIENVYGTQDVAQWSAFSGANSPTASTTRIAVAIAWAEAQVNNKLRNSPYLVPIQGTSGSTPVDIINLAATVAGWWLWNTRGLKQSKDTQARMDKMLKDAKYQLLAIINGTYPLDAIANTNARRAPFSVCGRGW